MRNPKIESIIMNFRLINHVQSLLFGFILLTSSAMLAMDAPPLATAPIESVPSLRALCAERVVTVPKHMEYISKNHLPEDAKELIDWKAQVVQDIYDSHRLLFIDIFYRQSRQVLDTGFTPKCVALSPDGNHALTSTYFNTRLWDLKQNPATYTALILPDGADIAAVCNGGRYVFAVKKSENNGLLFDLQKKQTTKLYGHRYSISCCAFSTDGRSLATGSFDGTVLIYDLENLFLLPKCLDGHQSSVRAVAFNFDGTSLLTGSSDFTLQLWDLTKKIADSKRLDNRLTEIQSVAFSPDATHIASYGAGGGYMWDLRRNPPVIVQELKTPPYFSRSEKCTGALGPLGKYVIAANSKGFQFTNLATSKDGYRVAYFMEHKKEDPLEENAFAISADANTILISDNGQVICYRLHDEAHSLTLSQLKLLVEAVQNLEKCKALKDACEKIKNCAFWKDKGEAKIYELLCRELRESSPFIANVMSFSRPQINAILEYKFHN